MTTLTLFRHMVRGVHSRAGAVALMLIVGLVAATHTGAQEHPIGPVAKVDHDRHDFKTVWVNELLRHVFTIRNEGDAPLHIIKVRPACGCTRAGEYPKVIAPGEHGAFLFQVKTGRLHGRFSKLISITTNDPANERLRLTLAGEVRHYVDVKPPFARFGRVQADSVVTRKFTLTNNTDSELVLSLARDRRTGCFHARLEELVPGKVFDLIVTARPPYKTGMNRHTLVIETNLAQQERISVRCTAELPKRLEVRPDALRVPPILDHALERSILFTNNGETPVRLLSASATDARVSVRSEEIAPGKRYRLTVTIPPDYVPSPDCAIVLTTDDRELPEQRIAVRTIRSRSAGKRRTRPAMTMLGKSPPADTVTTFRGEEVRIAGASGKVQLLAFYASWCGHSKRAMPVIESMHRRFREAGKEVEVIAVNLDHRAGKKGRTEQQTIEKFAEWGLTMPLVLDSHNKLGRLFQVTHFPTLFVLGKGGVVEAVHIGPRAGFEKSVAEQVELLLAGKTRADFPKDVPSLPVESRPVRAASPRAAPAGGAGAIPSAKNTSRAGRSRSALESGPDKAAGESDQRPHP